MSRIKNLNEGIRCSVCLNKASLRLDGIVVKHYRSGGNDYHCPGGGLLPYNHADEVPAATAAAHFEELASQLAEDVFYWASKYDRLKEALESIPTQKGSILSADLGIVLEKY